VDEDGKPLTIYGNKIPILGIEIPQGSGVGGQGSGTDDFGVEISDFFC